MSNIVVVHDDREKKPWDSKYLGPGFDVEINRMKTGDYTIKGMETVVRIEKKTSWEEIIFDVSKKQNRENFIKMLRRLSRYPVRALVIHTNMADIHKPRRYTSVSSTTPLGWLFNICFEYGVPVFLIGNRTQGRAFVQMMFRKIHEYNEAGRLFQFGRHTLS